MRGFYLLLFLALVVNVTALAQSAGDFRSATSGPWNQAGTWETFDGAIWNPAVAAPTAAAGEIRIIAFTVVDITSAVNADQIVVETDAVLTIQPGGGSLTVAAGGMTIDEGDGFSTFDGLVSVLSGTTITNQGTITSNLTNLQIDGTFIHSINGGVIPNGSWNDGSLLSVTGTTSIAPTGFSGQSFYDISWNTNQTASLSLAGALTSVRRDFTLVNTGTAAAGSLQLTTSGAGPFDPLVIGRNLTLQGNSALAFGLNTTGVGYSVDIGGNLDITSSKANAISFAGQNSQVGVTIGGNFIKNGTTNVTLVATGSASTSGIATVEVNGNFTWSGGTLTMASGSNGTNFCVGTLNLGGDLTISAGSFTETSSSSNGRGAIVFDDAKTHNFTSPTAAPFANTINFTIPSSNRVNIGSTTSFSGTGGMLLSAGATLGIASPQGISLGTGTGNIRVSATGRSYAVNSNIVYNGSGSQNLGDEWGPSGKLNGVAVNLEIANSAGVINNITPSTNLVGNLTLTSGAFDIGSGNTLTIQANFTSVAGTITGHLDSNLAFAGSGTITGNLNFTSGSAILDNFTINRSASVFLGSDLTINQTGALIFSGSGNLRINGNTLTINGDITQSGVGAIASSNTASNLYIGGSGTLTALPLCTSCGFTNEFGTVTLDRSGGASYTWNSAANINTALALVSGTFTHSSGLIMATGSTFSRSAGTTYSGAAPNVITTYNVSYTGNLTTSAELPTVASNALNNLTVAGNVTLDKNVRINGNVSITSGTLDATTHNVNMAGATFAVNGGSFTINAANTVTFSRAGTTALSGSTINNSTFGNLTINSGTTVSAPNANINITGVWSNSGTFNPNNGTVTFNGTTQNINANGQPFWNLITDLGTKTLTANLDVNGTLTINPGSTLNASTFTINIADTWDNNGTFTAGTSTVIFDGNAQTIDGSTSSFNNVTLATGGTKTLASALDVNGSLTINSGVTLDVTNLDYGISVGGGWTNNGTFTPHNGTVTFDGSITQLVAGSTNTQFYNITQTNPSTLTISSAQSLVNALSLQAGTFNPNGNFTMISTPSGDARIDQLGVTATIANSNMTIQRYLPNTAGVSVARYLSSPVSNATLQGWKDDFPITGPISDHSTNAEWAGQGLPTFNETGSSILVYNESKVGTIDNRYDGYPLSGTIATSPIVAGVGYNVRPRFTTNLNIELVGRPNFGPVSVNVTAQGVTSNDGWNLVGNPYPSPINWANVSRPAGLSAQIALKDNTNNIGLGAGQYVYYTAGGTGIPASYTGTIAQGQAFWVRKTTTGSATLTFQEDDKQATSTPPFMREGADENILRVHVSGNTRHDELVIAFNDNAQDIQDVDYDAVKLVNSFTNFYSVTTDNAKMAINTLGSLACSREIPLALDNVTAGAHTFTFSQLESFPQNVDIRLLDNFTGETFVVSPANTTYNFDVTANTNSFGANRFKVYVGYKDLDLALNVQAQDYCSGNDAQIKVLTPQTGVAYFATLNGTTVSDKVIATEGSDVTITIPKANLTTDESIIVIKAQNGTCAEMPLVQSATINKKNLPSISAVTGATNCGESSVTLSADGAPADGSYRWYLTEDATDAIAGETASSFTTPTLTKTKTYFVSAVNALGCEGARTAVVATISYAYDITEVTNGQSCDGGAATLIAAGAPESGSYRWYVSELSTEPIGGQTAATFVTPSLTESTTYYVSTVNAQGCEGARVPVTAELVDVVEAAIDVENDLLVSNSDSGNQWYLNGTAIQGATSKTYKPTESGVYKLVVTVGTCSSQVEREFAVTGDINGDGLKGYVLYPNPTPGLLYVEVATAGDVAVSVLNPIGLEVTRGELKLEGDRRKGQFDISGHAAGVYLVVIKHGQMSITRKIVKN